MSNISNILIKNSFNYVLQSDLTTGIVYRIGGDIPINPIFSSGLTINKSLTFKDGSESDGYVLTYDSGTTKSIWKPLPTAIANTYVTGFTYSNNELTILQNDNETPLVVTIDTMTGLTINGTLSGDTVYGNFYGDGNNLSNINISSINNLQTDLDSKINNPDNAIFDDYLYYNGSNWVGNRLKIPVSAGAGITLFLETSGSTLPSYELLSPIASSSVEEIESVVLNNNTLPIDQYATAPLGRTKLDSGIWEFNSFVSVDIPSSASTNLLIGTYLRTSGGVETLLFTSSTINILSTNVELYTNSVVQPVFNCNVSDRLVVKYSGKTSNIVNTTLSLYHGGSVNYSHIHTPFITQHNDLSGIQGGSSDDYYHLPLSQLNLLTTNVDASSLHNHYGTVLGLTGGTVSGLTNFTNGIISSTVSATTYNNLPIDVRVTGGTYSSGVATFKNNTGGTFSVTGLTTPFTGGTITGATNFTGGLTANTISATTYNNLPIDVKVTGGTYSSGVATFKNNTGGTFTVTGFTDYYVTGGTFNTNTDTITLNRNDNNSVSITGITDWYTTGFTYSNNTFSIKDNSGSTFNSIINTMTGLTVNGNLTVNGTTLLSGTTNHIGAVNITGNTALNGNFSIKNVNSGNTGTVVFDTSAVATGSSVTVGFQNKSGTVALLSDLSSGEPNSKGYYYMENNAVATVCTSNASYYKVSGVTSTIPNYLKLFTTGSSSNRLVYTYPYATGSTVTYLKYNVSLSVQTAGGALTLNFQLRRNNTPIPITLTTNTQETNQPTAVNLTGIVTAQNNDIFELWVNCTTNTSNVLVTDLTVSLFT